jgi:hypothetical protein
MASSGCIDPNPDIAGIGVRSAIYAQNLLLIIPSGLAIWDGRVTPEELKLLLDLCVNIHITVLSLILAAFIEFSRANISFYHATTLNNLVLIYILSSIPLLYTIIVADDIRRDGGRHFKIEVILTLMMFIISSAIFGILVWIIQADNRLRIPPECTPLIANIYVPHWLPLKRENTLAIPILAFTEAVGGLVLVFYPPRFRPFCRGRVMEQLRTWMGHIRQGLFLAIVISVLIQVLATIVYLELTLAKNRHLMTDQSEEKWTFGQLIAVLLLVPSVISIIKMWKCSWGERDKGQGGASRRGQVEEDQLHELRVEAGPM